LKRRTNLIFESFSHDKIRLESSPSFGELISEYLEMKCFAEYFISIADALPLPSEHVHLFIISTNTRLCTPYIYTCSRDEQSEGLRCMSSCTRVCMRACALVGSPLKKSLSFPHSQGAASHTSVHLLLYTRSRETCTSEKYE